MTLCTSTLYMPVSVMNSMTDFFKSKLKQKVAVGKREREEEAFCDEGLRKRKEMAF